jgi:Skp family chaperone for outer membrane proteins
MVGAALWRGGGQTASAQGGAVPNPCCVGVLRLNDVLNALEEKARLEADLKLFFSEKEAEVNALLDKVKAAEEELKLLSRDAPDRGAKLADYAKLRGQARVNAQVAQAEAEERKKQMELQLFGRIREAAAAVAKRQGLMLVLVDDSGLEIPDNAEYRDVQGAMMSRRALYADPGVDISSQVANYLNNQFKAGGAKSP